MSKPLPDLDILMVHPNLGAAPRFTLPAGYRMRFYRDGDVPIWVAIQQAADDFFTATSQTFTASMPGDVAYLAERVMFLADRSGKEIGTITAWHSNKFTGVQTGQVHWVAIRPEAQGKGLAKPMLSAALDEMVKQGYGEAWLETNTMRLPALNLYLLFGFKPHLPGDAEQAAWRQIEPYLKYGS